MPVISPIPEGTVVYSTFAAFPTTGPLQGEGNFAWADDTNTLYAWDADTNTWILIGGGGGVSIPIGPTPPAAPANGDLWIDTDAAYNNMLMGYDGTRSKWLSVTRPLITFGFDSATPSVSAQYLRCAEANDTMVGYRLPRDGTLVAATAQISDGNNTKVFEVRKNGAASNLATLTLPSANGVADNTLNVDFVAGDYIQARVASAGAGVKDPVVALELAWRDA